MDICQNFLTYFSPYFFVGTEATCCFVMNSLEKFKQVGDKCHGSEVT